MHTKRETVNVLYLCYLSLFDPLVQSQVVAYIEGLTSAGHRIILLTFEPRRLTHSEMQWWKERLASKGIQWYWLRYHKRPSVVASSWDILVGIVTGLRLMRRHNVQLIHARVHVPGLIALVLKRLTGARMLFDIRGFMAEEYVDGGLWKQNGLLYRITKRVERALVNAADAFVVLTTKAKGLLMTWYPREVDGKPVEVIPCCVDLRNKQTIKPQSLNGKIQAFVYVGKLDGWYLTEQMVKFFAVARKVIPDLRFHIWTQSNPARLRQLFMTHELNGCVSVGEITSDELQRELQRYRAGLSFVKPCLSKLASSPTKVGEYLAAGLPVVTTPGIGDLDDLLRIGGKDAVGVVVREFSEEGYLTAARQLQQLLSDPDIHDRCRTVAEEYLDLERVGWPRYRMVYEWLIGKNV